MHDLTLWIRIRQIHLLLFGNVPVNFYDFFCFYSKMNGFLFLYCDGYKRLSPKTVVMIKSEMKNESELIRKLRLGDEAAFEILFHRYKKRVKGFVHKMLPSNICS